MKKMVKTLLVIISIGVISISLINIKKELKEKDVENKKLAVFIKQEDGSYKTSTSIPQIGYTLNIEKSTCSNGAKPTWNNNTLKLSNLTSENTNCYLYFDEDESTKKLKELGLTANTTTPDFSQIATEDEGIFGEEDGMYGGTSYYWRGAATTNYLQFGGFCWRIIRINGDGSLRLIYDGSTCHNNSEATTDSIAVTGQAYNSNRDRSEYVGYTYTIGSQRTLSGTASNLKTQLESWYSSNLASYTSKIANGKYCNDRDVASGYSWSSQPSSTFYYAGYDRSGANSASSVSPTLSCPSGDVYTLKVGAITMDEVVMAGGKWGAANSAYYLYNGQYYWTMSPYYTSGHPYANVFLVYNDGDFGGSLNNNSVRGTFGVRPVINLKADTIISTGNGTIDSPFVVEGAE